MTGDREGPYSAKIADDVLPIFKEILSEIGQTEKIDLFLYSRGGSANVPWKIVSLIREYCDEFSVLIPFRAHSAATMIALGADEIVCGSAAELGPIDPSLTTPFNPRDPQGNPIAIGIEAVRAYLDYVTENPQLNPQVAFDRLASFANPLALGEVFRQHNYIRSVAINLLKLQKNPPPDEKCEKIVKKLVEELYFHGHAITRKEAKEIGLNIIEADSVLEKVMWDLYLDYAKEMKLNELFNPMATLEANNYANTREEGISAFIESEKFSYAFKQRLLLEPRRRQAPNLSMNLNFQLPSDLHQMIQQNPQLNQLIQQILQRLIPQIQQQVLQELNKNLPVEGVDIKVIERGWVKIR